MKKDLVIIQFDGDDSYFEVVDMICFGMGLNIADHVKNIPSAKKVFEKIADGRIKPDIAIVSGFLQKNQGDGKKVEKKLRELLPDIKIIAYSILPDPDWGDVQANKLPQNSTSSLIAALETVTKSSFQFDNAVAAE